MTYSGGSATADPPDAAGAQMDNVRAEVTITPYRDGPLLVRGPFRLVDEDGFQFEAGRAVVALCRCGRSRQKPFCDGTHALARFRAGSGPVPDVPPDS